MKLGGGVGGAGLRAEAGLWKLRSLLLPPACSLCATGFSGPQGLVGSLRSSGAGPAVSDKTLKSARLVFKISPPGLVFIFLAY